MVSELERLTAALADLYRPERELGRGGMATVYLAQDLKHHRPVAIKVLKPELAAVLGAERFLREIEIAARLNHPHILPLFDSGEALGFLYYVMPHVEGESLRERLTREKQISLQDALQITRAAADALSHAHSHGVIHRDIKPENILLEAGHAVVADFGIARAINAAGGERLTETGVSIGTPAYMSPEQAAGSKDLDARSDQYSLACVVYEMLAGQPPFTGPTVESLVHQHLAAEPPSVTAVRAAVPAAADRVIRQALHKTAADRFATAIQFADALATAVEVPIPTPPASTPAVVDVVGPAPDDFALAVMFDDHRESLWFRPDRPEYDFSKGVRGVTAARYREGTNVVVLDPAVMDVFPDSESVNEALRALAPVLRRTRRGQSA